MKKKKSFNVLVLIIGILVIGSIASIGWCVWSNNNSFNSKQNIPGITISTDKTEYSSGGTIKINVNNSSDKTIFYDKHSPFWGIEYYKENNWINPYNEPSSRFRVSYEKIGTRCYVVLFDSAVPITTSMKTSSKLSDSWAQETCPYGTLAPAEQRTITYISSGKYRLSFIYGLKTSEDDPYRLSNPKTVYSNIFTIN